MSESKSIKIFFVGSDLGFWHSIKERYQTHYPGQKFTFSEYKEIENFSSQALYLKLTKMKLDILYIDYSFEEEKCIALAKLISKGNETKLVSTVGLHNYLATPEEISRSLLAGIRLNHIKSGEISDLVYHPFLMRYPDKAKKPEMAEAKLKYEYESNIIQDLRVAYALMNFTE